MDGWMYGDDSVSETAERPGREDKSITNRILEVISNKMLFRKTHLVPAVCVFVLLTVTLSFLTLSHPEP